MDGQFLSWTITNQGDVTDAEVFGQSHGDDWDLCCYHSRNVCLRQTGPCRKPHGGSALN